MSVTVRKYKRGGWEVDIRGELPDGRAYRERRKSPVSSKSGSKRWGEQRERELLEELSKPKSQPEESRREVPILKEFAPRFLENYARANRQKPSGVASKETILRVHLVPLLGQKRLDEITSEDVQGVKQHLSDKATKTVNNVLTVLSKLMKVAVEWDASNRYRARSSFFPSHRTRPISMTSMSTRGSWMLPKLPAGTLTWLFSSEVRRDCGAGRSWRWSGRTSTSPGNNCT